MIAIRGSAILLKCNKCKAIIRREFGMATKDAMLKLIKKRRYCGECIQERINKGAENGYCI
jgi:NAD-dependent SIR2 family protein deacetylase